VLNATGDPAAAVQLLERVLSALPPGEAPYQHARLLTELTRHRVAAGDDAGARLDAHAAVELLGRLDVVTDPADQQRLDDLVAHHGAPTPEVCAIVDHGTWVEIARGPSRVRLPVTKGLRYLAMLVERPGTERHVLDLVDRVEGVGSPGEVDRRRIGDAGDVLDSAARTAYRRRIERLQAECDDALEAGLLDAAEAHQVEIDALVSELSRAFGLGGGARQASSTVEKARLNVTRAIRTAVRRIEEVAPAEGAALDRGIRTGTYCAYEPADGDLAWIVQSDVNGNATP
jgi:hypothetical protein